MIAAVDPSSGRMVREYPALSPSELEQRLARAAAAFDRHRRTPLPQRAERLRRAADHLEADGDRLARLMAAEMGKPYRQGVAEVEKCAWVCRYYADEGERMLAPEVIRTDAAESYVRFDPLGPVLAVMPWNFPLWQVFRFAAPALMAGNVGLLKHASNVPGCALAIEEILARGGFDSGEFQTLLVDTDAVAGILDDPRVRAATLTGSTAAGSAVAARAGERIKKTVLELGGSDPFVVMPSADLEHAVEVAVIARTINNGQSCIAAKRFIVHQEVYQRFAESFTARMQALVVGDPLDPAVDIGPLATASGVEAVAAQVDRSVAAGARLLCGGERPDGGGFFYPPTVLADIPGGAPAHDEEIFGPVASLFRANDLGHAIQIANHSRFGLGSSFWSHDAGEIERFVTEVEAGQAFVNSMVASDPRLPFGGVKESGYGRELGVWGIREFVNVKTVSIAAEGGGGALVENGAPAE